MRRPGVTSLLLLCALAGCTSPEATRVRGGGPGADTGNRDVVLRMHGGSEPFYRTPRLVPGEHAPLAGAHQARDRARER